MSPPGPDPTPNDASRGKLLRYATMGFELAASVAVLTLLGAWIDKRYATAPLGVVCGALLGSFGGLYNFSRQAWLMTAGSDGGQAAGRHKGEHDSDGRGR